MRLARGTAAPSSRLVSPSRASARVPLARTPVLPLSTPLFVQRNSHLFLDLLFSLHYLCRDLYFKMVAFPLL